MPPLLARRRDRAFYVAAWVPIAALLAAILHFSGRAPWAGAAALAVPAAALLAFLCLAAQYPAQAFPVDRTPFARLLGAHFAGAAVATVVWLVLLRLLVELFVRAGTLAGMRAEFDRQLPLLAGFGVLVYLLAVTVHHLLHVAERTRLAERRALEHELHAREAELKLLRAQIDPHFLFNSLNSIAGLIQSDPALARSACVRLGSFLRSGLRLGARDLVRLDEEMALARDFLAVEQARFGSRLRVSEDIPQDALGFLVPPLILQPLVENAVRHGIAGLVDGGTISLRASLAGQNLKLAIENDRDPEGARAAGQGLGLANVRRRLEAVYGEAAMLALRVDGVRFTAELTIPARAAAPGGSAGAGGAALDSAARDAGASAREEGE
jgi:two-component system sensor histidine kinase AlgZ